LKLQDHLPADHRLGTVYRYGAGLCGLALLVFGSLGFLNDLEFLSTSGERVAGLSSNGLLSLISVVVAVVLIAGAVVGGNAASTVNMAVGTLFLGSGFVNLALLDTKANFLAFHMQNVMFSFVVGLMLLTFGMYGRVSGGLPHDNPYWRARHPAQAAHEDLLRAGGGTVPAGTITVVLRRVVPGVQPWRSRSMLIAPEIPRSLTGNRQVWAQPNASSCPTDDHHFVAFGVGDPPAILRLVKEPATGCDGRGEARLREVRRHGELEVDAVALPAPLRLRSVELLEHQHRVQPPRIVDVVDPGSPVGVVSECGDPERADRGDVGGVEEELSEARQPRIRCGPEFAGSGLEVFGEVGEVELEAVGVGLPLVLTAVDDHEPGAQVDQQREARVVGQRRCCGGQVTLLRRRGDAVARHRAEHRLPVGCPDPLAERRARHQVDLVAVGVGVTDPERSRCLTKTRLLDRRGRPHHVEVDAVTQRP